METNKKVINIEEILGLHQSVVRKVLKDNGIKRCQIRSIFKDEHAWKRRDEFYSLFKTEHIADLWWENFMDNYYLEHHDIILDEELKC